MTPEIYAPSEAERIDISRRSDLARAIARHAIGTFTALGEIELQLKKVKAKVGSAWPYVIFFSGLALNELLQSESNRVTWAASISIFAASYLLAKYLEMNALENRSKQCNKELREHRLNWSGSTGEVNNDYFWKLRKFEDMDCGRDFEIWWREPRNLIIWRSCGYENGQTYTDYLDRVDQIRDERDKQA